MSKDRSHIPGWAIWLFNHLVNPRYHEELFGDLEEIYEERLRTRGKTYARLVSVVDILHLLRGFSSLKNLNLQIQNTMLIKNYLLLALRNLRKNKGYTLINILGLCTGISCALIIFAYIDHETKFDRHHARYDRIIRITEELFLDHGNSNHSAITPPLVFNSLQNDKIPELEAVARLYPSSSFISVDKNEWTRDDLFVYADSTVADLFSFEVLAGSLDKGLTEPFNLVITESILQSQFGATTPEQVIGKELHVEDEVDEQVFNIAAVIRDAPSTSHFDYHILASFRTLNVTMPWHQSWYHPYLYTYGLLSTKPSDLSTVQDKINSVLQESLPTWEEGKRAYHVQNLSDIHLTSNLNSEWTSNSRKIYIQIFTIVAGFIILIACVNFVNLATAKAIRRAREVGIRKVMGATRSMLIFQFLGESTLIAILSLLIAFGLTELFFIDLFSSMIDTPLSLSFLWTPEILLYIGCGFVVISLLSGFYPAFSLSSFKATDSLRKQVSGGRGSSLLRKVLVAFQFTISCFLIAGTLIVLNQINFMRDTNLGFTKDYIILVKLNSDQNQINYQRFIDQLESYPMVQGAVVSSHVPGDFMFYDNPVKPDNSDSPDGYNMFTLNVGPDFAEIYDLEILQGRNFDKSNGADIEQSVLVNETAVDFFNWKDEAVGQNLDLTWYTDSALVKKTKVIGVIKDFHFKSLHNKVDPLILHINTHPYYVEYISVRFTSTGFDDALSFLEEEWNKFSPDRPLESRFLDDKLASLYHSETRVANILTVFAMLAILISCLGLLGLSAYAAEKRTKEIGIRKTMGANVKDIVALLSKSFVLLIVAGNMIALPIVLLITSEWLSNFAYKTPMKPGVFLLTLLVTLLLGFVTISFQAIKAAFRNPVDSLKEE